MPTNRLTDAVVKRAAATGKPYKLTDGGGLALYVTAVGGKSWRLYYRRGGKAQTATLGRYPDVTLAQARQRRSEARQIVAAGERPTPTNKRRAGLTLADCVAQYWDGRKDVSSQYKTNATRGLERHILPALGARPIASIERADYMQSLAAMDAKGLYVYVRKTRRWLGQVLDWAVEHGHCETNHVASIRPEKAFGKRVAESFAAIELEEVPALLSRLAVERRTQSVIAAELLMLTWVRTGELRGMRWSEIEGDTWRIPEGRMKRRREHLVPLSTQALALIAEMESRRASDEFVFVNDRSNSRPMSENAVLYLLHRIGLKGRMTGHGFRSVGSTWANENGWNADAVEAQLAHSIAGVRGIYNRAAYISERRSMLQAFADWVQAQRVRGDVVSMPSIRASCSTG